MKLKDILIDYKRRTGYTNDYIAKQIGVNKSTVSRWVKDDIRFIKPEVIENLSHLIGLDLEPLLKDTGKYQKPIIGIAKAGYGLIAEENFDGFEDVSQSDYYNGDYFLRVTGDSMDGAHIHDQDLIYVRQCDDVPSGTIAVVLIGGDEVTVKRVIKKENLLILEAANPAVENKYFTYEEVEQLPVRIIAKVLYSRSDFY